MISLDTAATEVFQILRSYDYTVLMYDDDGNQIYEPENARRFFAQPEGLLVSLVDEGDNSSIRLYLGKSTELTDVLGLDQTLRMTSTKYNMIFHLKRTGREIVPTDFATKASVTEAKREDTMNVLEGMYGTTRSSYLKLENARMIVRHSRKIDEMVMGSRGRHIDAIFVENVQGERFLFPTRQLAPARAMTQHVNQGGGFADMVGQQIIRMANDYANLGTASGHIATNSTVLGESALSIRETCRHQMYEMRKCFERLSRANGPEKWAAFAEALEEKFNTLNEGNEEPTPIDITEVKDMLTVEGSDELDESILTTVAEALRDCKCDDTVEEGSTTEMKDPKCPTCGGGDSVNGQDCPSCGGSGIESISVAGRNVSLSAWNEFKAGKLEFFHQPSDEMADADGKGMGKPQFLNKDAELSYKLSQIVPEVKNDSMLNFLSYVSEQLQDRNSESRQKSLRTIALHALNIAGMGLDVVSPKNEAVREFSEWLSGFDTNTVLAEREDDEREEPSFSDRFPSDRDPTSHASGARDDAIDGAAEEVMNDFDPMAFLEECGDDFAWGDNGVSGDLKYEKAYIMRLLTSYLERQVQKLTDIDDVDMTDEAKNLWDSVEPLLTQAGYSLSESEFGREDVVIPTNQGEDLKREVTKASSTDPSTGEEVPVDSGYIERLRQLAGQQLKY